MVVRRLRRERERGEDAGDAEGGRASRCSASARADRRDGRIPGCTALSSARAPLSVDGSVASSVSGIEGRCRGTGRNRSARPRTRRGRARRAGRPASAWPRSACAARTDGHRPGRRAARRGRFAGASPSLAAFDLASSSRRLRAASSSRGDGNDDHSAGGGARLGDERVDRLFLPVGRRVAAEVEQPFERIEDGVAATAAHPALGHLELVLDDSKRRPARGAARRQTHRQIMPCGARRIACRRGGSSLRPRRRRRGRARARRRCAARRPGARARPTGPAGRPRRAAPHSTGASSLSGAARMLATTSWYGPTASSGSAGRDLDAVGERVRARRLDRRRIDVDRVDVGARRTGAPRSRGRPSRSRSRGRAARPRRSTLPCSAIQRRHIRVVGCVPVPKARPGSSRITSRASAGTSDQVGTIQNAGVISHGPNCAWVRRTQSCSPTASIDSMRSVASRGRGGERGRRGGGGGFVGEEGADAGALPGRAPSRRRARRRPAPRRSVPASASSIDADSASSSSQRRSQSASTAVGGHEKREGVHRAGYRGR